MIGRIWHGDITPENAEMYEKLLKEEIFIGIQNRHIPGFQEMQLLRRNLGTEVEFVTIMWFDDLEPARAFAGDMKRRSCRRKRELCSPVSMSAPSIMKSGKGYGVSSKQMRRGYDLCRATRPACARSERRCRIRPCSERKSHSSLVQVEIQYQPVSCQREAKQEP
jgi:heme-degrading monooxygenase HmoA